LGAHHGQQLRQADPAGGHVEVRYNNACPGCGFRARNKSSMPRWNGCLPEAVSLLEGAAETTDGGAVMIQALPQTVSSASSRFATIIAALNLYPRDLMDRDFNTAVDIEVRGSHVLGSVILDRLRLLSRYASLPPRPDAFGAPAVPPMIRRLEDDSGDAANPRPPPNDVRILDGRWLYFHPRMRAAADALRVRPFAYRCRNYNVMSNAPSGGCSFGDFCIFIHSIV
jgi:hypothetical protein